MRIKLAENFRALFYAPFYAAQALGFYAAEGVAVELLDSAVPGDAIAALLRGEIDVTWGGPMRVMKARDEAADSPLLCFCEVVARDPFYLIGRSDRPGFQLGDLSRLRFAAVSEVPTPWMCLQHDLRLQGLDPARVGRTAARTMAQNFAALRDGELDVIQVFEPYVSMALQQGAGEILYAAAARGPTVYTAFIATRDAVEWHRSAFAAMIRAMRRTQRWLAQTGAEELADVTAPFFPHIPRDILVNSFRRYGEADVWARSPEMSRPGFARLAESLVSGGFISRMPSYADCVERTLG